MLLTIFKFELNHLVGKRFCISVYLFIVSLISIHICFGLIPIIPGEFLNSSALLGLISSYVTIFFLLIGGYLFGSTIINSFDSGTSRLYFSYPFSKFDLFWGKYLANLCCLLVLGTSILVGVYAGCSISQLLGLQGIEQFGAGNIAFYLYYFFLIIVPNLFFISSLYYVLILITQNIKAVYVATVFSFLVLNIGGFLLQSSNSDLAALIDPFCSIALRVITKSWSVADRNFSLPGLAAPLLVNRFFWIVFSSICLVLTYKFIRLGDRIYLLDRNIQKLNKVTETNDPIREIMFVEGFLFTEIRVLKLIYIDIRIIFLDIYFWAVLAGVFSYMFLEFFSLREFYGVRDVPRTVVFIEAFEADFPNFFLLIITFFTGELIRRDHYTKFSLISDSYPVSDGVRIASKFLVMVIVALLFILLSILVCITIQVIDGYRWYNFPAYFVFFVLGFFPKLVCMISLAFFFHCLIFNRFIANSLVVLVWVLFLGMGILGLNNLLIFASSPFALYSEISGISFDFVYRLVVYNFYWISFSLVGLLVTYLFFPRGVDKSIVMRCGLAKDRLTKYFVTLLTFCLGLFVVFFFVIFFNRNVNNGRLRKYNSDDLAMLYENAFKDSLFNNLPNVRDLSIKVDIHSEANVIVSGAMVLGNSTSSPISYIVIDASEFSKFSVDKSLSSSFSSPMATHLTILGSKLNVNPALLTRVRIYRLNKVLLPNDTVRISYSGEIPRGGQDFRPGVSQVQGEAVFLRNFVPNLGFDLSKCLVDASKRSTAGLPPLSSLVEKFDRNVALDRDMTVRLEVSSPDEQKVVSAGVGGCDRIVDGRRHYVFFYKGLRSLTDLKIFSGRYSITKERVSLASGRQVSVEIFYDPKHANNISNILRAYSDGLIFFSKHFGDYPFSTFRIVESSAYVDNFLSSPGLDAYSERSIWHANFLSGDLNYVYYLSAAQLAKQWWGGDRGGVSSTDKTYLRDGIARYCALRLIQERMGFSSLSRFLDDEYVQYIQNFKHVRGTHNNQGPGILSKSSSNFDLSIRTCLTLFGGQRVIGARRTDNGLLGIRDYMGFVDSTRCPVSDVYVRLRSECPEKFYGYLDDLWNRSVFFDKSVSSFSLQRADSVFQLRFGVRVNRLLYENGMKSLPYNGSVEVAVNAKALRNLRDTTYFKTLRVVNGEVTVNWAVTGEPLSIRVDPFYSLNGQSVDFKIGKKELKTFRAEKNWWIN